MAWYILYPKSGGTKKRCALRKVMPSKPVVGYDFVEGPLATLTDVSHQLNAMGIHKDKRPIRDGRVI